MRYIKFANGTLFCFDVFRSSNGQIPSLVTGRFYMANSVVRDFNTSLSGRTFSTDEELVRFFTPRLKEYSSFEEIGQRQFAVEYKALCSCERPTALRSSTR